PLPPVSARQSAARPTQHALRVCRHQPGGGTRHLGRCYKAGAPDAAVATSPAFLKVRLRIGRPDIVRAQDPFAPKVAVGLFKGAMLGSDNAPMASFFGTLKTDLVHPREYPDRATARRDLFAYIAGYCTRRCSPCPRAHST